MKEDLETGLSSSLPTYVWMLENDDFTLIDYNTPAELVTEGKVKQLIGSCASQLYCDTPEIFYDFWRCYNTRSIIEKEYYYKYRTIGKEHLLKVRISFCAPQFIIVRTQVVPGQ